MLQTARWKVILVLFATVWSILFALPNVLPEKVLNRLPSWASQRLNLGLDLRGGAYLQLEADTGAIKEQILVNMLEDIRTRMSAQTIAITGPIRSGNTITVDITNPAQLNDAYNEIVALTRPTPGTTTPAEFRIARRDNHQVVATFQDSALPTIASARIGQAIIVLHKRLDPDGNKEISITREGQDRIVVQAPGDPDPQRLADLIGRTAQMTFQMVDQTPAAQDALSKGGPPPPGSRVLNYDERGGGGPIIVRRRAIITGEMLTKAALTTDQFGRPAVQLQFNREGAKSFGDTTARNIGKNFAIVLDDQVISAPTIQGAIPGGTGQITGVGTNAEAKLLSDLLNAGALPVPLKILDQKATTAELGAEAIQAGKISTAIGFISIVAFMFFAYGFRFGGVSILGLILNLLLMTAILSVTQATLTLPGVAGLILTLAVAVDANVLIYERIRDEERAGATPFMAMEHGFQRASVSILDANATTLISAGIMFIVAGAGPVKGFAWTLAIGVFTSVFTAMMVSQVLLGWWFRTSKPKQLPI